MLATTKIEYFQGSYAFLSNFYPCKMIYKGLTMPTLEHCYVMHKAAVNNADLAIKLKVMTPGQVKKWGRTVPMIEHWDELRFHIMSNLIREKFSDQNVDLKIKLIETGDSLLVEGNTWGDRYWGQSPIGKGENNLGKILMKHRDKLQSTYK